jgi:hypothetical protein
MYILVSVNKYDCFLVVDGDHDFHFCTAMHCDWRNHNLLFGYELRLPRLVSLQGVLDHLFLLAHGRGWIECIRLPVTSSIKE